MSVPQPTKKVMFTTLAKGTALIFARLLDLKNALWVMAYRTITGTFTPLPKSPQNFN
jgi:hypothetical protein